MCSLALPADEVPCSCQTKYSSVASLESEQGAQTHKVAESVLLRVLVSLGHTPSLSPLKKKHLFLVLQKEEEPCTHSATTYP